MLIGFVGDTHGRVFHAIAALATWQAVAGRELDLLIQVGDLGAYPDLDQVDSATNQYLAVDPAEADFSRLLRAEGRRAEALRHLREQFRGPVHFLRGNHEDFAWLRQLPIDEVSRTARVDPFDLFCFVPDGTVLQTDGTRIAFLGGAGEEGSDDARIDRSAWRALMDLEPGQVDVLVTHDAPYGISVGYRGRVQGSQMITDVAERLQPAYHVAGHLALNGPRSFGRTIFLCLNGLVESPLWRPEARGLEPGCLAVLDTAKASLSPVTDSWLAGFDTPLDFDSWLTRFRSRQAGAPKQRDVQQLHG